jgi:hypothetical protein
VIGIEVQKGPFQERKRVSKIILGDAGLKKC